MQQGERASKIPDHLRLFLPVHVSTNPQRQYRHVSSTSTARTKSTVELCPPHWRLTPHRSFREALKDVLLKDWQGLHRQTTSLPNLRRRRTSKLETLKDILVKDWQGTHRHASLPSLSSRHSSAPVVMRMKDSDDYITARAANPRTGLISPSIGNTTPRLCTPATPGEALEISTLSERGPSSPNADLRPRPPLRRANEGRKVSAETVLKWRADGCGWVTEPGGAIASPRVACIKADAGINTSKDGVGTGNDKFAVRMPSASEPQPYAYPGCSTQQIEAFERYRQNSRILPGGWHDPGESFTGGREPSEVELITDKEHSPNVNGHRVRFDRDVSSITIPKRRKLPGGHTSLNCHCCGAEQNATSASFLPPRTTTDPASVGSSTAMKILPELPTHLIHRKPVASSAEAACNYDQAAAVNPPCFTPGAHHCPRKTDLRTLPSITFIHPDFAGIPHYHHQQLPRANPANNERSCSLSTLR